MSKLGEDIKAGVKGIRGAGDVLRGEVLEATDKIFEKRGDPRDMQAQARDRAITEKGKADLRGMDNMFARREWERKGVPPPTDTAAHNETYEALSSSVPTYEQPAYEQPAPQHAAGRSSNIGAGAPPLPDRPVPDEALRYDTRRPPPTDPLQREPADNMPPSGVFGHNAPAQGFAGGVPSQTTHPQRQYPPGQHVHGESVPGVDFPPEPRHA